MDLTLVTGYGPPHLSANEGRSPLVRPEELKAIDLPAVRSMGIEAALREAVDHLTQEELDGFFIHIDADWPDDVIMPVSDSRLTMSRYKAADFDWRMLNAIWCALARPVPAIWPAQHLLQPLGSIAERNAGGRGLWLSTHLHCQSVRPGHAPLCGRFENWLRFAPRHLARFDPPARNYFTRPVRDRTACAAPPLPG
ncbi:hypothetical protein P3T31_004676 [Rhizobium sp. AN70]|nr:hypothetical protein [Rhizobium sp. AN70]MDH7804608.1 hypothetical protein [Rhizobium sp. AN70]